MQGLCLSPSSSFSLSLSLSLLWAVPTTSDGQKWKQHIEQLKDLTVTPEAPSSVPEDADDIISARSGPVDGTSGSTDSSPQHPDSANTTEDTTPDNSGAVQNSVMKHDITQVDKDNLQIGLHNSYIDIIMSL